MKIQSWLPYFSGFYNSFWEFDENDYRMEWDYINGIREENGLLPLETCPNFDIDTEKQCKNVGEYYCEKIEEKLKEYELNMRISFEEMYSPREYNFSTDSINCTYILSKKTYKKLIAIIEKYKVDFHNFIHDRYTSCSGFMSYYSNNGYDWISDLKTYPDMPNSEITHKFGQVINFVIYILECETYNDIDYSNFSQGLDMSLCEEFREEYYLSEYIKDDYTNYMEKDIKDNN